MREYWIVMFAEHRWSASPMVAGPWPRKKEARDMLRTMKADPLQVHVKWPVRFIVRTVR